MSVSNLMQLNDCGGSIDGGNLNARIGVCHGHLLVVEEAFRIMQFHTDRGFFEL